MWKKYFEVQGGIIGSSNMTIIHTDLLTEVVMWFSENAEHHDFLG